MTIRFLLDRARERSTWLGLTAILAAFGLALSPDQAEAVASLGAAAAGLAYALFPETGRL